MDAANNPAPNQDRAFEVDAIADKYLICTQTLVEGFVQSFVDFFYLTHSKEPTAQPATDEHGQEVETGLSSEKLFYIKNALTEAEAAKRGGDMVKVFESYQKLAEHYEDESDYKTCIYFWEKCLEISKVSADMRGEMDSNRNLGLAYEKLGNVAVATKFHQRYRELAAEANDEHEIDSANQHLVVAYKSAADEALLQHEYDTAIAYFEQCRDAAQACQDVASEGLANYRLGMTHSQLGRLNQAVEYHQQYLVVSKQSDNKVAEGQAHFALAKAYESLGDIAMAIKHLEAYLEVSQLMGDMGAQGEACRSLGVIYNQQHDFINAVYFFEKTFEIARSLGDRKTMDSARVNLGLTRGNAKINSFMEVVNHNVDALIKWKNRRIPFDDSATAQ